MRSVTTQKEPRTKVGPGPQFAMNDECEAHPRNIVSPAQRRFQGRNRKVSFVTKVRYLGCGVGYYEQVGLQNDAGVLWLKAR
jgi:hypothetical protein